MPGPLSTTFQAGQFGGGAGFQADLPWLWLVPERVDGIGQRVEGDLLDLDAVAFHWRQVF